MRLKRIILPLLLSLATVLTATGSDIKFKNIHSDKGLSNNHVNSVLRDSKGLIWIGTASGLDRYDGYTIKNFRHSSTDTNSLHNNYVEEVTEDKNGNLWILAGSSYSILDPSTEKFHHLGRDYWRAKGIDAIPNHIVRNGDDIWMSVINDALYFSKDNSKAVKVFQLTEKENSITDMAVDQSRKKLYAVSDKGVLYECDLLSGQLLRRLPMSRQEALPTVYDLFVDSYGQIWNTSINGASILNPDTRRIFKPSVTYEGRVIRCVNQDRDGRIWIGYDNDGLEIIDSNEPNILLTHDPRDPSSISNNSITCIYMDPEGSVWVGTHKRGVSVYGPDEYDFRLWRGCDVNCIAPDRKAPDRVWIGTDKDGLMSYDCLTSETKAYHDHNERFPSAIVSIEPSNDGGLWIGTYLGGLKYFSDGRFYHITKDEGLTNNSVWSIIANPDGTIWIATLGGGLQLYNPADRSFKTLNVDNSNLRSNFVQCMVRGRDGMIYIGTTGGVECLNPNTLEIDLVDLGQEEDVINLSRNLNQLFFDSRQLLWMASREGLGMYDLQNDSLYIINLNSDKTQPFVLGICETRNHTMWVTVDDEIYTVNVLRDRDTGTYSFKPQAYRGGNGLDWGTFNQRSMCLLSSGNLLAGCLNGILTVIPERISEEVTPAKVIFTDLYLRNQKVEVGKKYMGKVIIDKSLPYTSEIRLPHSHNDLSVYFTTDNFARHESDRYEYRLNGFDKEWIKCPKGHHNATYTNLPYGNYTLEVRTHDSFGEPNSPISRIGIIVSTPWWWSWWAVILYILLIIVSIFGIIRYVKVRERHRFIEHQKEEQIKKNEELNQLKFSFFTNISHDLRTPLTLILSPIESMLKEQRDEKDNRRLKTVKTNAAHLMSLVNQLLDFRKNEMVGLQLRVSSGDIVKTVKDTVGVFTDIADRRNIKLSFETNIDTRQTAFDNDKVRKTVMNLVSNAFKYTPDGGEIKITLLHADSEIRISVADSGRGVSDEDKAHIFECFYRSNSQNAHIGGAGIGLHLVKEYVRLHGGTVSITDNKPNGAVFTVTFPDRPIASKETEINSESMDMPSKLEVLTSATDMISPSSDDERRPKILVVDDNKELTDFLRDEFSDEYRVTTASDGKEALKILAVEKFDLIVSDIMMPNMDGIQLSRILKADPKTVDLPLILLTAKQDVGSVIEGLTLGADDYVTKPFNNDVLALKIRRLVSLSKRGLKGTKIDPTPSEIEITPLDEQLVAKAVKYVEENMGRSDLSVEELSSHMGMSRVHLYKKILALTGKSPIEFIRILRLKRAAQYLRESQLNVAEIAYKLGFNNPKYFSKYFKAEFGLSPSEYQDKNSK